MNTKPMYVVICLFAPVVLGCEQSETWSLRPAYNIL